MLSEGSAEGHDPTITSAQSRVSKAPAQDWVKEVVYDADFKPATEAPVTFLLLDTQIHAEQHEEYIHKAVRLSTMEAVQHWSQWRLQFEPKTQMVQLHTLKLRRGNTEIDQLDLNKAHFLQREEGLERFTILGWFTLLMVLEDVRPGDVLEFSYTIRSEGGMFPDQVGHFFTLPPGVTVGKYYFSVRFNTRRPTKWKSCAAELAPVETRDGEMVLWEWSGTNVAGQEPEVNTPGWSVRLTWIQVSDFPDWKMIATGAAQAWSAQDDGRAVTEIAGGMERQEPDPLLRIEQAIRLVQDEYRYLSVNLEFGGYTPTPPETVAHRRYGDCKDLTFLLVQVLKRLGIKARPVLVNTGLRKSICDFLPLPSLFNHVIVEAEIEGQTRWIDTTIRAQGGGPLNRFVPDFGLGLPIDTSAADLVKAPSVAEQSNRLDLREHVLLDTSGATSLMSVTLEAEGYHAEALRKQFQNSGVEAVAKQRLESMEQRCGNATREGKLQYRDDRMANKFVLVEVFAIDFFPRKRTNDQRCGFPLPANRVLTLVGIPPKGERKTPFALPYPCRVHFTIDVDCTGLLKQRLAEPYTVLQNDFLNYAREGKSGKGYYVMDVTMWTKGDNVPANEVDRHRVLLEQIWNDAGRQLVLPTGYPRTRPKPGFGELPVERAPRPAMVPVVPAQAPKENRPAGRTRRPARRHQETKPATKGSWVKLALVIVGFLLFFAAIIWFTIRAT